MHGRVAGLVIVTVIVRRIVLVTVAVLVLVMVAVGLGGHRGRGVVVPVLEDAELGRRHAAPHDAVHADLAAVDGEAAQGLAQGRLGQPGVHQGPEDHVAGRAGRTVEVQDLHRGEES